MTAGALAGAVACAWAIALITPDPKIHDLFLDFRANVWEPGRAILAGESPLRDYSDPESLGSVYPPAANLLTLPFALPPYKVAAILWLGALVLSVLIALRLCGVRDWRCVALALASPPVINGIVYGNVSLVVVLVLAGAWVWRDRPLRGGAMVGLLIATRVFLWPLAIWLLFTGRRRAAASAVASTVLITVMGWAAVAFRRIDEFADVTRRNAWDWVDRGVSVASLTANLGGSRTAIVLVSLLAGLAAFAMAWRRRHADLECFAWTLVAALFISPIVWPYYYAMLLVPLALATPYLSRAWLLPYLTAPQLAVPAPGAFRVLEATLGVAFAVLTARTCRPRSRAVTRDASAPAAASATEPG